MHTRRSHLSLAFGALLVASAACRSTGAPDPTFVRLRNASAVELTAVAVTFPGRERLTAATLASGAATPHMAVREAYRYARIEATARGERLVLQPIDYVGETPLGPGRFTYELTVDVARRRLDVQARPDGAP